MSLEGAGYRTWQGRLQSPWWGALSIVRISLALILRRWLFWILLALGAMNFLYHFAFIYLKATLVVQDRGMARFLDEFKVTGSGEAFLDFMHAQAAITTLLLAFAGSLLIGADYRRGGMIFYLSRSMDARHYIVGKLLAVSTVVLLMTAVPALILYVEYGVLSSSFEYFRDNWKIAVGILGFGMVLAIVQSLMLFAIAVWIPRTVPLVMTWLGLFVLLEALARALRAIENNRRWLLVALWEDMLRVGHWCFGSLDEDRIPSGWDSGLVLLGVCVVCLVLIIVRVRAVEIVR